MSFTGTYMLADSKTLEMWGILSNVLYEYPAYQAIEEGTCREAFELALKAWVAISIPFKKLPDYVPTSRSMLRTRELGKKQQERNNAAKKI